MEKIIYTKEGLMYLSTGELMDKLIAESAVHEITKDDLTLQNILIITQTLKEKGVDV